MDAEALIAWYEAHRRELPWRKPNLSAYEIWLSEVVLQQTRVVQGLEYYLRFLERFPSVRALAEASEGEVLLCWQGLGYYSRARNLHTAARQVMAEHGGEFPTDYLAVRSLKGVGEYTAAAVCSFSTNAPYAVVDGNVYRVLARQFDLDIPIDSTAGKKQFATLAQELLKDYLTILAQGAGRYNQAMMELGALICTPRSPLCRVCPVSDSCLALCAGTVAQRPVKQAKARQTPRYFNYLHLIDPANCTVLHRRTGRDIWQGLYEFPLVETPESVPLERLQAMDAFRDLLGGRDYQLEAVVVMPPHLLSHRVIHATFYRIHLCEALQGEGVIPAGRLGDYAISRLTERYLESL